VEVSFILRERTRFSDHVPRKLKPLRKSVFRETALASLSSLRKLRNACFNASVPSIPPSSTGLMYEEEEKLLDYLSQTYPTWVNLWKMLNLLCGPRDHWLISRPKRRNLLAVFVRIKNEGKAVYHRRDYSCRLSPAEALRRGLVRPGQDD
jgi:hypothetical protein